MMKWSRFIGLGLLFVLVSAGVSWGRVTREVRRETVRLERLATNVWKGMLEEISFGHPVDQRTKLDVFNFVNGVNALKKKAESRQAGARDLADIVELLQLQSQAVDRSLRNVRIERLVLRDWEETRRSLNTLARLLSPGKESSKEKDLARNLKNVNDLRIQIREVRPVGNFFENEYRVRGVILGRNIVSAGIYSEERLLKPISVRLHDERLSESPFAVRLEPPEGDVKVRVIDVRGFVLEKPVEFPAGGLLPGLR